LAKGAATSATANAALDIRRAGTVASHGSATALGSGEATSTAGRSGAGRSSAAFDVRGTCEKQKIPD